MNQGATNFGFLNQIKISKPKTDIILLFLKIYVLYDTELSERNED